MKNVIRSCAIILLAIICVLMVGIIFLLSTNNEMPENTRDIQIRVLLKNDKRNSVFYEELSFSVKKGDICVEINGKKQKVDNYDITYEQLKDEERIVLESKYPIFVESDHERKGEGGYEGTLEVLATKDGMVLVNEVPLEEYLCTVVPSEMPFYYPQEALKAQAVCARSYAYEKYLHPIYREYDAHLDDTSVCQVYHKNKKNYFTTKAVLKTRKQVLFYEGQVVNTFFYSTSCGIGTTEEIWGEKKIYDYIDARSISIQDEKNKNIIINSDKGLAEQLEEESFFQSFLNQEREEDLEKDALLYRWDYNVKWNDQEFIDQLLVFSQNTAYIEVQYENKKEKYDVTKDMLCSIDITKRLPGGVVDEMMIETLDLSIRVKSEQWIRKIFAISGQYVETNKGSKYAINGLLPSAFLYIKDQKHENGKYLISLRGGGFGHGVGMSQNAAFAMADEGLNYVDILRFFYKNTTICALNNM